MYGSGGAVDAVIVDNAMLDVAGWGKGVDTKLPFRVSVIQRESLITMKRGHGWELSASGSMAT